MKIHKINANDITTNTWSGGTTTQLYIFPENADYKKREFDFRISTATVEAEESTFTPLPNVERWLMILDGAISINHKDHYSKHLEKFDTDHFSGNWETTSRGRAVDFNLMTTGNLEGNLKAMSLQPKSKTEIAIAKETRYILFYAYKGGVSVVINMKETILNQGDIIAINLDGDLPKVTLETTEKAEIALATVHSKV